MVSLIVAVSRNGVIGKSGGLPWRLKDDMAWFVQQTEGKSVIMGRKTYESIPAKFRPLANRRNIVVTRDANWSEQGTETTTSLEQALQTAGGGEVMVAGGGEIYAQALAQASTLYVTEVHADIEGDTFFPTIDTTVWKEVTRTPHQEGDWHYDWVIYKRA